MYAFIACFLVTRIPAYYLQILVNVATFIYMNCGIATIMVEAPVVEGNSDKTIKATVQPIDRRAIMLPLKM